MRVADALKYCVALPVCLAFEVIRYASVQQTRSGKIGVAYRAGAAAADGDRRRRDFRTGNSAPPTR